ncbi:MAG: RloB domain-containing protein [Methylococcaceae bacterium]|nr:RloB domain-containing protein [Methylococcaceae bacterium]
MARQLPKSRSISRKLGTKSPKFLIIAVCEGKNTEPEYLKSFAKQHGNGLVEVETVAPAGAPVTIVKKAVERKKDQDAKAKKTANSFDTLFEVWAVFDVDEHPNIPQARDMAKANKVHTAISNPCIEIWALWHITPHCAHIHRHDLQSKLASVMPNYDPEHSKQFDFEQIKNDFAVARRRAERQLADHEASGNPFANPSTTFYRLLDKIIENGT